MKEKRLISLRHPDLCNFTSRHEDLYFVRQSILNKKLINFDYIGVSHPDPMYEIFSPQPYSCDIEYVISGRGIVVEDGREFAVEKGDTFMLYPGKARHYYADPCDPWEKMFVNFSGEAAIPLLRAYMLGKVGRYEGLDTSPEISQILEYAKHTEIDSTVEISAQIHRILKKMYDYSYKNDPDCTVEVMKEYLNNHIYSYFSMEQFSHSIGKSKSQITRLFKKAYDITPYNYLMKQRISVAQNMLANSNEPLKNIAAVLCFYDEYYFSSYFKSATGLSPTQFRRHTQG